MSFSKFDTFVSFQGFEKNNKTFVLLKKSVLDVQKAQIFVSSPQAGAISLFIGTTRDNFEGKKVIRLEYECYEEMAYKELLKICCKMRNKWDLNKISISHRLGEVPVMEASVVIAVSSSHRADAIQAVSFCIDELKRTVPIWKKEFYEGEVGAWKENCTGCSTQESGK